SRSAIASPKPSAPMPQMCAPAASPARRTASAPGLPLSRAPNSVELPRRVRWRMTQRIVTCRTVSELRARVAEWRKGGETIGLVPTMGALHEGHLALVRRAQADNRKSVVTLFVNPTQFGPNEDLAAYPRHETADRDKLADLGVDVLYAPPTTEMYAPDAST